jgi:hypothetical protein
LIGSQYTLNGTIQSIGIYAPICEGDNTEWDNVVYHIESVTHNVAISEAGARVFTTTLSLCNGLRSDGVSDTSGDFPIYPGFKAEDNTAYDPGLSLDDQFDRGDPPLRKGDLVTLKSSDGSKEMESLEIQTEFVGPMQSILDKKDILPE